MNRTTGLLSASKSSTAASEGSEWEEKTQRIGRHGYRKTSVAAVSSQSFVADKRPLHKTVSDRQGGASFAVDHMAREKPTSVSSAQQLVGVSMGALSLIHI